MGLRNYQLEAVRAVATEAAAGARRMLISLPTGCGKTILFAAVADLAKGPGIVLVHLKTLVEQTAEKLRARTGKVVEIEQASKRATPAADIVVASIASLYGARLEEFLGRWGRRQTWVVYDEAHHAAAKSNAGVVDRLLAGGAVLVGLTATPNRAGGLGKVFERIIYQRSIVEMVKAGWLCDLRGVRVRTATDLAGVRVKGRGKGDFDEKQLAAAINEEDRNALVVAAAREWGAGRPTVIFAGDIAHVEDLAGAFEGEAVFVHSKQKPADREAAMASFVEGRVRVIVNCGVLTEGWDHPPTSCVVLARPTRSSLLYTQMVGRGTRIAEGKADCVVVDLVDATDEHALATLPSIFGLPAGLDLQGSSATAAVEEMELILEENPLANVKAAVDLDDLRARAEEVDLLALAEPPTPRASLAWTTEPRGVLSLQLFVGTGAKKSRKAERLELREDLLGWAAALVRGRRVEPLWREPEKEKAVDRAEEWVATNRPDTLVLARRAAGWRRKEPKEEQLRLLEGVRFVGDLTRGAASQLIDHQFARERATA